MSVSSYSSKLLKPMAMSTRPCIEACRAAALASHSAAGLVTSLRKGAGVDAAKFGEVARLLRSSEALARAAVAALTGMANQARAASPERTDGATVASQPASKAKAKRRGKKQNKCMASTGDRSMEASASDGVPSIPGPAVLPAATADAPMDGTKPRRTLQPRISRERSPRPRGGDTGNIASHSAQSSDADLFAVGSTVVLHDLQSRTSLNGSIGNVISYDSGAGRYAVCVGSDTVRVKRDNLQYSK